VLSDETLTTKAVETLATKAFETVMVFGKVLLSRPSLDISSNRGVPFSTARSALQTVFNAESFTAEDFLEQF